MYIWRKAIAVFFKKCCFCDKNFKWKDKVEINILNNKTVHCDCYVKFKNKFKKRSYNDDDILKDCEFYGQ